MHVKKFSIISMAIGISLGAIGAHLLKGKIPELALETFETGVRYQIYHSLALLFLSDKLIKEKRIYSVFMFMLGIFFFSLNCYLYAITQVKTFAMLVPIGGFLFIFGWIVLLFEIKKLKQN